MQQLLQNNPFWLFCQQHYAKNACRQALLALQDEHGMNVNQLLLMAYLEQQQKTINAEQLQVLSDSCQSLQRSISELRTQRRAFKLQGNPLYESAKAAELGLEQLHIAELYQQSLAFDKKQCKASGDFANIFLYAASTFNGADKEPRKRLLEQFISSTLTDV